MIFKRRTTQAEFEQEVMPHLQSLYGVAVRMTRCDSDAEDLVQDTILRAYRFWDGFQRGTNARAWLMRIMTNLFRNRYRERAREQEVLGEAETSTANVGQFQGAAPRDAESALFGRMLSRDVEKALALLPPEFRLPVILADLEDLSYKEIADIMECPAGTVMSRLYRGRRMLQKMLSDYAGGGAATSGDADPALPAGGVAPAEATGQPAPEDANLVDFAAWRRKRQEGGAA
jgi:RNA polymerase sigma-70 factor (ECF subfamily)